MTWAGTHTKAKGFTLIELLVVVSIIAILAGIVLVGYNAVQLRTFDSTVQADLASNAKILAEYYSNNNIYPTQSQLATMTPKLGFATMNYNTSGGVLYCRTSDGQRMALLASSKTGNEYYVTDTSRTPRPTTVHFPVGVMSTDCSNIGVPDPSNGTSGDWIYTSGAGWDSWVK